MADQEPIRFYFSFRSPYSWLALVRVEAALAPYPVALQYIPVFPPPDFKNDPTAVPNKLAYIRVDMARIAEAYGITATKSFSTVDTNWVRPHAAFLYAQDHGKGCEFARSLYDARFVHGADITSDTVMSEVASAHGLDPAALIAASLDEPGFQTRVVLGMIQGAQEDAIFGVPLFVFRGERFWGNDRIEWLVRSIRRAQGLPVIDLSRDPSLPLDR